MEIDKILQVMYPTEMAQNKIRLADENDGNGVFISYWDMPIPQPTNQEIQDWATANQRAIDIFYLSAEATKKLQEVIDLTAKAKSYENGISCASYANSTNAQWAAEAQSFIAWRDSVWSYAINLLATLQGNEEPIPSIDDVVAGMPQITWPEGV